MRASITINALYLFCCFPFTFDHPPPPTSFHPHRLREEVSALQANEEALAQKADASAKAAHSKDVQTLHDDVRRLTADNAALSEQLQAARHEVERVREGSAAEGEKAAAKRLEGQLADTRRMLESSEHGLEEETQRNDRLEARIQMCLKQLKLSEDDRIRAVEDGGEEVRQLRNEREYLVGQVRALVGQQSSAERDRRDLTNKLEQFGWILGQRGALVRELHRLHKSLEGAASAQQKTGAPPAVRKQAAAALQQSTHLLNTYLSEVERKHLGLPVIVHPQPDTQCVSPRALLRLLEHSPLTQQGGASSGALFAPTEDEPPPYSAARGGGGGGGGTPAPHTPLAL